MSDTIPLNNAIAFYYKSERTIFVTLINDSKCLTWKTPTASAAMAACNGVRPVMSSALQSAPTSNNTLAASVLAYLAAR